MSEPAIPRRTFLRGLGAAVSLPLLEAMLPLNALASSAAKSRPNRMAFIFVPNGMHMPAWTPQADGTGFALPSIMEPLKNVKDSLTVLTGLTQHNAEALGDGGGDHARSAAAWLTGCHPRKTSGADIKAGISVDQLAAQKVGRITPFPSLELGCEPAATAGDCDTGYSCAYTSNIAWRSATMPLAHEVSPRLVFERLFGNGDPNATAQSRAQRRLEQRSILDFVMEDAHQLNSRLGVRDQSKLDEYFSSIREIEERLNRVEKSARQLPAPETLPTGVPSDMGEHIRLMYDMMTLAFQSDMTRICTFMIAHDGSNRSYPEAGVPEGHHDMSHHGGDPKKQEKIRLINHFHVTQLAYLLEKLQSIHEPEGTLLDNAMIVYGAGISDGNAHNHDNLPILLAGRGAGTIQTGRHVRYTDGTPMTNLFLSLLDRIGVRAETIGDSTGRLQQLF
ncbi:MAG TPA: DUF1552 domain-containing protein [Chthonomonadaceae bacterium]|nr:DUF1552 domain-containing protein [Chthonomonadaceae bacterium]